MSKVIELENLTKAFGDVVAVDHVSLSVERGEIVCLLGPSGCGKTTTLRMIAGFDQPTEGTIHIDGKQVSSGTHMIPPERRNLGMVFQNYAVWPHMTVSKNVAYPLKIKRVRRGELRKRVAEAIRMVGLEGLEHRYPEQLSGGQQQRVALARALIVEPVAMLLDEPLSNLDAKLREKMRFEIMDLHRRTGITVIYVTHDQAEAMVLSDRIMVMNLGVSEQIGPPAEIYRQPASPFVADFIGLSNFAPADLIRVQDGEGVVSLRHTQGSEIQCVVEGQPDLLVPAPGLLFVRPEDIELVAEGEGTLRGTVVRRTFLGNQVDYRVDAAGLEWRIESNPDAVFREQEGVGLRIKRSAFLADKEETDAARRD